MQVLTSAELARVKAQQIERRAKNPRSFLGLTLSKLTTELSSKLARAKTHLFCDKAKSPWSLLRLRLSYLTTELAWVMYIKTQLYDEHTDFLVFITDCLLFLISSLIFCYFSFPH